MGLISFIKNAGASIFGGSEAKAAPAEGGQIPLLTLAGLVGG